MRRLMFLALFALTLSTAGALWGQRSQACNACPTAAEADAQFPRHDPKPVKPEKAKQQHGPKRHSKGSKKSLKPGALGMHETRGHETKG